MVPVHVPHNLALTSLEAQLNGDQSLDQGPDVTTGLYFTQIRHDESRFVPGSLVAVAALSDRVVVIFPSTSGGFDLAQGGLDLPWQVQHLSDVPRGSAGAIDAVRAPDGGVFIVLRERFAPEAIHFFHWKLDGTVTAELIERTELANAPWWQNRCPDVRLGVSRAGDVDLLFQQNSGLMHARRKAGQPVWETQLVWPAVRADIDIGCVNRIAYDEADLPQVLTIGRTFGLQPSTQAPRPTSPDFLPTGMFGDDGFNLPDITGLGFFLGGDGRWRVNGPVAQIVTNGHFWNKGSLDLELHPDGFLLSGVNLRFSFPQMKLEPASFVRDPTTPTRPYVIDQPPEQESLEGPAREGMALANLGNMTKLQFSPCGAAEGQGVDGALSNAPLNVFNIGEPGCVLRPLAPIARDPAAELGPVRTPVYAHGDRAYDVGVCLYGIDQLGICQGGFEHLLPGTLADPTNAPELVSAQPAQGGTGVSATLNEVVLTLSRPLTSDETVRAQVAQVSTASFAWEGEVARGQTNEVHVPMPAGVVAGTTYRVALSISKGDHPYAFIGQRAPVVSFRRAGSNPRPDPRLVPTPQCVGGGVQTATSCERPELDEFAAGTTLRFGVDYDVETNDFGPPRLEDDNGVRLGATVRFSDPFVPPHWADITFTTALSPATHYRVVYPVGARDSFGAEISSIDRHQGFTTRGP